MTNGQIEVPEHKTRLAAVALDFAYREGKPVERHEHLHGDLNDFPQLLEKLRNSPTFQALQNSEKKIVKDTEIAPTSLDP